MILVIGGVGIERASLGKPIVPIVFFHMKINDYPLNYIWGKVCRKVVTRHLISMEEHTFSLGYNN